MVFSSRCRLGAVLGAAPGATTGAAAPAGDAPHAAAPWLAGTASAARTSSHLHHSDAAGGQPAAHVETHHSSLTVVRMAVHTRAGPCPREAMASGRCLAVARFSLAMAMAVQCCVWNAACFASYS